MPLLSPLFYFHFFVMGVSAQYYKYHVLHFAMFLNTVEAFGLIFHNHSPNCCAGRHKPLLSCCTGCGFAVESSVAVLHSF